MLTRDEATTLWKDYVDGLWKALESSPDRSLDHYLTFKRQVFAMIQKDSDFLNQVVDILTPPTDTSEDRKVLLNALAEEIRANTRELEALASRASANPRKKNLEALRHATLGRAGTVTGSIKDFGEMFFEKNQYAKAGLALLKELIEICQTNAK